MDTARQLADLAIEDRDRISGLSRAAMSALRMHRALMGFPITASPWLAERTGITPAAVNKSLEQRDENIDAYDLYFVIRNCGSRNDEVCACLQLLLKGAETKKALEILTPDFVDPDSLGPSRVAQFQYNEPNPDLQADVAGYIRELLDKCSKAGS